MSVYTIYSVTLCERTINWENDVSLEDISFKILKRTFPNLQQISNRRFLGSTLNIDTSCQFPYDTSV